VEGLEGKKLSDFFADLLAAEVEASRRLEAIAFGSIRTRLFRTDVILLGL
jgi:hypothetical protein